MGKRTLKEKGEGQRKTKRKREKGKRRDDGR